MPIDTNQPTVIQFVINHTVLHGLLLGSWAPFSTFAPKVQDPTIETNETDSGKGLEHVEIGDSWLVERPTCKHLNMNS